MMASLLLASPAAAVGIGPSIQIFVDGLQVGLLSCATGGLLCDDEGIATLSADREWTSLNGDIITLNAAGTQLDPDPVISYVSTVTDNGSPSTFNFVFSQGIVLTAAPGTVSHAYSSNTNDGNGNGVQVNAAPSPIGITDGDSFPNEIAKYTLSLDGDPTFLSAGLDLQSSFTAGTGSNSQTAPTESGAGPAAGGSYDLMRVDVNFSLTGGGDRYGFNGRAQIDPEPDVVPEPGTGALLGLGLIGVALGSRREPRRMHRASQGAPAAEV